MFVPKSMHRFALTTLSLALLGGACSGTTTLVSTPITTVTDEETPSDSAPETSVATGDSEESPPSLGDRENPAAVGSTVLIKDASGAPVWEISLVESNLNVNDIVAAENMFNSPPPEGFQFASAKLNLKYVGNDKGFPGSDIEVAFVSAAGTTHKEFDVSAVGPREISSLNELYPGGTADGYAYVAIPTQDAASGTWRVSAFLLDTEFHFAAR